MIARFRTVVFLFLAIMLPIAGSERLDGQAPEGYGWSSWGVLPFRGYDYIIAKAPSRYILYFNKHSLTSLIESAADESGRAFSTDLRNWTLDSSDFCATSGDLCGIARPRAGLQQLPDGRLRMFVNTGGNLVSAISSDGIFWTREPGIRLAADPAAVFERGNFAFAFVSFVTLADGSVRMYYMGGAKPGTPGTPSYYNSIFNYGMILSALSRDNGVTWTREPGVRINALVQGPAIRLTINGAVQNQVGCNDVSAVAVRENDQTVFRIFCDSLTDGAVSYASSDGLIFALEGQVPADAGDPKAFVMPDGRTWLVTNQFPDAINDVLVYGPQSLFMESVRADNGSSNGPPPSFRTATLRVTGNSTGPVTFEAVTSASASCGEPLCTFHPEYYSFSPSSGTPPFSAAVTYVGPSNYATRNLFVHAKGSESTAVAAVYCMRSTLGRSDTTVFCKTTAPQLPMNNLTFVASGGTTPAAQTSNLFFLGGEGYPFAVSSAVPWVSVSPASGTAPQPLTVTVNPAGLAPGTHTGVITVAAEGTVQQIAVTLTISGTAVAPIRTPLQGPARVMPVVRPPPQ